MSGGIVVRQCQTLDEFHACVALEREIWGEQDLEVEPATSFVLARQTGGQVLGAFDGPRLVAYTLAVAGIRDGRCYLHSHMTGVMADYRDRGVGRMLKLFQRDEALSREIRLIEWTFDPLEMRNAHFNLNRLGAIARRYLANLYGITTSPLHRGLATDRLVAEWHLDSSGVLAALKGEAVDPRPSEQIELPAWLDRSEFRNGTQLQALQSRLRTQFTDAFARGYAAVGVATTSGGSAYQLAPWEPAKTLSTGPAPEV